MLYAALASRYCRNPAASAGAEWAIPLKYQGTLDFGTPPSIQVYDLRSVAMYMYTGKLVNGRGNNCHFIQQKTFGHHTLCFFDLP